MKPLYTNEDQLLDAKVDRVIGALKRVLMGVFIAVLVVFAIVLVLELKREFQIDIFKGLNFTIDDWYFENVNPLK